jgi:uncharacterized damage-inducible protein DinB
MNAPETKVPIAGFPLEIGAVLWTLEDARRRTVSYVEGISQEAMDRLPAGHRHSVATLLYHIMIFEVDYLYIDILGGDYDEKRRIPECPDEVKDHLPYPLLLEDGSYTPVSGDPLGVHLERMEVVRSAFLDVMGGYTVEAFRTLVQTGDEQATPEIVVEHLAQHEAEHRGAIWEARVAAEAELGIG